MLLYIFIKFLVYYIILYYIMKTYDYSGYLYVYIIIFILFISIPLYQIYKYGFNGYLEKRKELREKKAELIKKIFI